MKNKAIPWQHKLETWVHSSGERSRFWPWFYRLLAVGYIFSILLFIAIATGESEILKEASASSGEMFISSPQIQKRDQTHSQELKEKNLTAGLGLWKYPAQK